MLYSVIVPVYNRPDEMNELLESLVQQSYTNFEVIIVEDGSEKSCKAVAESFMGILDLKYFQKENSGQGFSRNYGFERARGDYFVVFDSDCILPPHYFEEVTKALASGDADCWGGPDRAHSSFSDIQKAVNYSMTSFFTTGGIRGHKKNLGDYHPRSFNMGISREVYQKTKGYQITRMGEDIEFSIRISKMGYRILYIEEAYVYHKRRTTMRDFYKQLYFFGRARINIGRFYRDQVQFVHWFPVIFAVGQYLAVILLLFRSPSALPWTLLYLLYAVLLFADALVKENNIRVATLSVAAGFTQLNAYANGFVTELVRYLLFNQKEPQLDQNEQTGNS